MNATPHDFTLSGRLEALAQSLATGQAAALARILGGHGGHGGPGGSGAETGVEALLAAGLLAGRSDLAEADEARITALQRAVGAVPQPHWVGWLPDPAAETATPEARLVAYVALSAVCDWARGEAWMAISELLDEAEVAFVLAAPTWHADGLTSRVEAEVAGLAAILALPAGHRARTGLALVAASLAPEPPELDLHSRGWSFEAALREVPLTLVARDLAIGALRASLPAGAAGADRLLGELGRGPSVWADADGLDAHPPLRVTLARLAGAEVNLVLADGGVTLEWWSAAGEPPDRCVALAEVGDGVPMTCVATEGRSRRWRLDGLRGNVERFSFIWTAAEAAREVTVALQGPEGLGDG